MICLSVRPTACPSTHLITCQLETPSHIPDTSTEEMRSKFFQAWMLLHHPHLWLIAKSQRTKTPEAISTAYTKHHAQGIRAPWTGGWWYFIVVSSDLQPCFLDIWVKKRAELSINHQLVVSWIRGENAGQTQMYCELLLWTFGRVLCQGGLWLWLPEELLPDFERSWGHCVGVDLFSASNVDVVAWSCGGKSSGASCGCKPQTQ